MPYGLNGAAPVVSYSVQLETADYTVTATFGEVVIKADNAAGFIITLPEAAGNTAKVTVKKMLAAGTITVDGNGAETIDGAANDSLTAQYETRTYVSDGTGWLII